MGYFPSFGSILTRLGGNIGSKWFPRGGSENCQKNDAKWVPKGSPNGGQMGAKIDEKRYPKTELIPRKVPGSPREPSGTILGAILEYFSLVLVFSHVFFTVVF